MRPNRNVYLTEHGEDIEPTAALDPSGPEPKPRLSGGTPVSTRLPAEAKAPLHQNLQIHQLPAPASLCDLGYPLLA